MSIVGPTWWRWRRAIPRSWWHVTTGSRSSGNVLPVSRTRWDSTYIDYGMFDRLKIFNLIIYKGMYQDVCSTLVANLAAVAASRVRIPASCQIWNIVHKVKTGMETGERTLLNPGNKELKNIFFNFLTGTWCTVPVLVPSVALADTSLCYKYIKITCIPGTCSGIIHCFW